MAAEKNIGYWILGILGFIAVLALLFAFKNKFEETTPPLDVTPGPVICDPKNPGYTTNGDFSFQCAGGTIPCEVGRPGYDAQGNQDPRCGIPCNPDNLGYDVNGNFNILCGGGVRTNNRI